VEGELEMALHMKIKKGLAIIVALAAYSASHAQSGTTPAHLAAADAIVTSLRAQGQKWEFHDASGNPYNFYGAEWPNAYAVWGPTAKVNARCASFVTLVMRKAYSGWTAKNAGFAGESPTAAMYYDAVETSTKGFTKVAQFEQVRPGDFLMAKYLDGSPETGHAMIVRSAAIADQNEGTGVTTWAVQVIDCSTSIHSNDTRKFSYPMGLSITTQGAGRGTMRVLTKNGKITGYSWSNSSDSKIYTPQVRALTLGRLKG
jgi:hypothetical protein